MCKSCKSKSSMSGPVDQGLSLVKTGAVTMLGYGIAGFIQKLNPKPEDKMISSLLPVAGSIATAMFVPGQMGETLAVGMAARGIHTAVNKYLPTVSTAVGIGGPQYMRSLSPGRVAGKANWQAGRSLATQGQGMVSGGNMAG